MMELDFPETKISHSALCLATAKRFIDKIALYEYKSTASSEEPDVLIYGFGGTTLFEIKVSRSDFNADKYKDCRKKYRLPHWARQLAYLYKGESPTMNRLALEGWERGDRRVARFEMVRGNPEVFLVEKEHLGNRRYFVCPDGVIPEKKIPEGWGLYYFKGGKFYKKRESQFFRSNLHKECHLLVHAMRRHGSGDDTGIIINTYGTEI